MTRMASCFISHGGGPGPWMPDWRAMFRNLGVSFVRMVKDLPERPKAILMISGHWEDESFADMSNPNPPMVRDCSGVPPATFRIKFNVLRRARQRRVGRWAGITLSPYPENPCRACQSARLSSG